MSSKKEDERNEKVIRGLLKLPPNRKCINCNSLGPQYVCVNFWTFICVTCSGIHREFTHRVKSISMAKFTSQEVEALQRGGNQRAKEIFLKDWDTGTRRLPDSSNLDRLREFIKNVYVDKKYAGAISFDKPPRDVQSHKNHEEHRRASSYHSYSQSPPYEDQYEERYAGKKSGMLTRKPGSDRGLYEGKISSFMYSPGYQGKQTYEDRFANETPNSRNSDYSVTSGGDSSRYDGQSPNLQDNGYISPLRQVRDILIEDTRPPGLNTYSDTNKKNINGLPRPQRTASSSSFGSFDSNSASLTPSSSSNIIDLVLESENSSPSKHQDVLATPALMQASAFMHAKSNVPAMEQPTHSIPSNSLMDMFAADRQPSSTIHLEEKELTKPFSDNAGWATFDLPHQANPSSEQDKGPPSTVSPPNIHQISQNETHDLLLFFPDQQNEKIPPADASSTTQTWDAFGFSDGSFKTTSFPNLSQISEAPVLVHNPPAPNILFSDLQDQEALVLDGSQSLHTNEFPSLSGPFDGLDGSSLSSTLPLKGGITLERKSTNPFDLPYDSELDANNLFPDMSSLQTALPDPVLRTDLLGGLPQTWFPQNSVPTYAPSMSHQNSVPTYAPSMPQGSLAYSGGQVASSQLRDTPPQGPVASIGSNPFA